MELENIFIYIVLPIICISIIVAIIIKYAWKLQKSAPVRAEIRGVDENTRSKEPVFFDVLSEYSNDMDPQESVLDRIGRVINRANRFIKGIQPAISNEENVEFYNSIPDESITLYMNIHKLRYMINDPELYNYIAYDIFMNKMAINRYINEPELVTEENKNDIFISGKDVQSVEDTYNNMIYTYNVANMRFSTDIYSNIIRPSITINVNIDGSILILELSVNSGMGLYISITAKLRMIVYKNIIELYLISVNISKLNPFIKAYIIRYFGNISHDLDLFTKRVNTGELNPQCRIILSLLADYINKIKNNYMANPYPILPNLDKFTDLNYIIDTINTNSDIFGKYISDIDINNGKITANLKGLYALYRNIKNERIYFNNGNTISISIQVKKNNIICNISVNNGVLIINATLPFKEVDGGLQYDIYNKKIKVTRDNDDVFSYYYEENTSGINQSAPDITKIIRNRFLHGDYDMFINTFLQYKSNSEINNNSRSDSNF